MAQLGGPVISTLAMGQASSPIFLPGTADILLTQEMSEILRPGFLEMLKEGGTILMNMEKRIPQGAAEGGYPALESIRQTLAGYRVGDLCKGLAQSLGDAQGQYVNVVTLGALSTVEPFASIPPEFWWQALADGSPNEAVRWFNRRAFQAGRESVRKSEPGGHRR